MDLERKPTADEHLGMTWWNGLSDWARGEWLRRVRSARPVDAWREFQRSQRHG